jgi:hypothetical protein
MVVEVESAEGSVCESANGVQSVDVLGQREVTLGESATAGEGLRGGRNEIQSTSCCEGQGGPGRCDKKNAATRGRRWPRMTTRTLGGGHSKDGKRCPNVSRYRWLRSEGSIFLVRSVGGLYDGEGSPAGRKSTIAPRSGGT